jgi:hypothetical protein
MALVVVLFTIDSTSLDVAHEDVSSRLFALEDEPQDAEDDDSTPLRPDESGADLLHRVTQKNLQAFSSKPRQEREQLDLKSRTIIEIATQREEALKNGKERMHKSLLQADRNAEDSFDELEDEDLAQIEAVSEAQVAKKKKAVAAPTAAVPARAAPAPEVPAVVESAPVAVGMPSKLSTGGMHALVQERHQKRLQQVQQKLSNVAPSTTLEQNWRAQSEGTSDESKIKEAKKSASEAKTKYFSAVKEVKAKKKKAPSKIKKKLSPAEQLEIDRSQQMVSDPRHFNFANERAHKAQKEAADAIKKAAAHRAKMKAAFEAQQAKDKEKDLKLDKIAHDKASEAKAKQRLLSLTSKVHESITSGDQEQKDVRDFVTASMESANKEAEKEQEVKRIKLQKKENAKFQKQELKDLKEESGKLEKTTMQQALDMKKQMKVAQQVQASMEVAQSMEVVQTKKKAFDHAKLSVVELETARKMHRWKKKARRQEAQANTLQVQRDNALEDKKDAKEQVTRTKQVLKRTTKKYKEAQEAREQAKAESKKDTQMLSVAESKMEQANQKAEEAKADRQDAVQQSRRDRRKAKRASQARAKAEAAQREAEKIEQRSVRKAQHKAHQAQEKLKESMARTKVLQHKLHVQEDKLGKSESHESKAEKLAARAEAKARKIEKKDIANMHKTVQLDDQMEKLAHEKEAAQLEARRWKVQAQDMKETKSSREKFLQNKLHQESVKNQKLRSQVQIEVKKTVDARHNANQRMKNMQNDKERSMAAQLEELKRQLKAERSAHQDELKKAKQQIKKVKQQYNKKEAATPEAKKAAKPEAKKAAVHKVKPEEKKHDNQVQVATQDPRVAEVSHELAEDKRKDEVQHKRITKEYKDADAAMSDLSKLADQAAHDAKKADNQPPMVPAGPRPPALATTLVEDEDLFDVDSLMSEAEAL